MTLRHALFALSALGCGACLEVVPLSTLDEPGLSWRLLHVVRARQGESKGRFGADLALTEGRLYVGAPGSDDCGGALEDTSCEGGVLNIWDRPLDASSTPTLLGPPGPSYVDFSATLAVDGQELWVGAPGHRVQTSSGTVTRLRRLTGRWSEPEVFDTGPAHFRDNYGIQLALARPYAAVLSPGAPCPGERTEQGVVHVFFEGEAGWRLLEVLCTPQGDASDTPEALNDWHQRGDVAIEGDLLAVGLPWAELGSNQGRVEVYRLTAEGAQLQETLRTPTIEGGPQNRLGMSVAIWERTLFVGAPGDGSVYVFEPIGTEWGPPKQLWAPEGIVGRFGASLAVLEGLLAVGAPDDPNCAVGVDPREWQQECIEAGDTGPGAVFLFSRRSAGRWVLENYIKAPWQGSSRFGATLALHGRTLAIGAPYDNIVGVGVDTPLVPDPEQIGSGGGAVYLFERED